jgi:hypothetical protein
MKRILIAFLVVPFAIAAGSAVAGGLGRDARHGTIKIGPKNPPAMTATDQTQPAPNKRGRRRH